MDSPSDIVQRRLEAVLGGLELVRGTKAPDLAEEAAGLLRALREAGYDVRPRVVVASGFHLGVDWEIRVEGEPNPRTGRPRSMRSYIEGTADFRCFTADAGIERVQERIHGIVVGRASAACQHLIRALGWRRGWGRVDYALDAAGPIIQVQLSGEAPITPDDVPPEQDGFRVRAAWLSDDAFRPDMIRASGLKTATSSTPGSRSLGSAVRWFRRTMAPEGWELDEERTLMSHFQDVGTLVARRGDEEISFSLGWSPAPSLKDQWGGFLASSALNTLSRMANSPSDRKDPQR